LFAEDFAIMGTKPSPRADALPFAPEELARTLRHEIGDFLQKVYAVVAILQDRLPNALTQERDLLAGLRRRAEQCKELVDEVQDFLCPVHLELQPVDLRAVVAGMVEEAQRTHPRLQVQLESTAPALVQADLVRLSQVGEALLQNAREFARSQVRTRVGLDPGAARVVWTVTDDGPGVSADLAPRLFLPFRSTRPGHAGLGLPLARKIVESHGGQISAANLPQGGFQVTVILPSASERGV
jgi:signal transduction histidine kinase